MRGPGPATGCFALESALDDLSYKLNIDPVELRLINHAEVDPMSKLPWTSKFLKECYALGREKIGWENRPKQPGTLKEDGMFVGYGMGVGVFWAGRGQASVRGILKNDGSLLLQCAVSDMGPGTTTAMVKIGSTVMQLPMQNVRFELGDTELPPGPTQGGSGSASAVGAAITLVCDTLKQNLKELAIEYLPVFKNRKPEELLYENGYIFLTADKKIQGSITDILKQADKPQIAVVKDSVRAVAESQKYAMHSFSVHFVKLHVHPVTGVAKIKQMVCVADAGKIITEKPARSQMVGGAVGGIGMALTEAAMIDHRYGRHITANLADYHVPVHADVPPIDVLFVNKPDPIINPMGSKGIGEIAIIGVAPAITNAIYNATGKRMMKLPVTPDMLVS
jgi:xanthine dehydrogenase YagR molybdenum-binding subunit